MKKLLLSMLGALVAMPIFAADGDDFEYQGVKYTVISEAQKTAKTKEGYFYGDGPNIVSGAIELPEKVYNGSVQYTLTEIGNYSFANSEDLSSITLPNSIVTIGSSAFEYCGLKSIDIPSSVTIIEYGAFNYCPITELVIPNTVTSLGDCLGMEMLKSVKLPNNIQNLNSFRGCYALESIEVPNSVTKMAVSTFENCFSLKSVKLPDTLEEIPQQAFTSCSSLSEINFPSNLKNLGYMAFAYCGLEEVVLPDGVLDTGFNSFRNCKNLKSISFGPALTKLWEDCYSNCSSLESITFRGTEPPTTINYNTNSEWNINYNISVYVPAESLQKYKTVLDKYTNIIPIGGYTGQFSVSEINIGVNQELSFPLNFTLNPADSYSGFQFDVTMPEGISLVDIQPGEALSGFTVYKQTLSGGSTRFIAQANGENSSSETEGVLVFTIKAAQNIQPGEKIIAISKAAASTANAQDVKVDDLNINVTVDFSVQSITLEPSFQYIKAWEYATFTAKYEPENAVNPQFVWEIEGDNSNSDFKLVKAEGTSATFTAKDSSLGTAKIIVKSALDETIYAEATLELIGTLNADFPKTTIKETETVSPSNLGYGSNLYNSVPPSDLKWTSSNPEYATVEASTGKITGVKPGETLITVASESKPYINTSFTLTVEPRIIGDANDNGFINVADVVAIANNIADYPVTKFCFVNADTDSNGTVNAADLTKTVDIILKAEDYQPYAVKGMKHSSASFSDYLLSDNFNTREGRDLSIGVRMSNTMDYVALQATMYVPDGMQVKEIKAGPRAASHSLIYNVKDDGSVKIVLFSLNNEPFAAGDAELFVISATADDCSNIEFDNIVTSDTQSNEYALGFTGGVNEARTSGMDGVEGADVEVVVVDGGVLVLNAAGDEIRVFNMVGETVAIVSNASANEKVALAKGFYVVMAGSQVAKVIVK